MDTLPDAYDWQAYTQLVTAYGTHYVAAAQFGGSALMKTVITQDYYSRYSDSDIEANLRVAWGLFGGGGGGGSSSKSFTSDWSSNAVSNTFLDGGDPAIRAFNRSVFALVCFLSCALSGMCLLCPVFSSLCCVSALFPPPLFCVCRLFLPLVLVWLTHTHSSRLKRQQHARVGRLGAVRGDGRPRRHPPRRGAHLDPRPGQRQGGARPDGGPQLHDRPRQELAVRRPRQLHHGVVRLRDSCSRPGLSPTLCRVTGL